MGKPRKCGVVNIDITTDSNADVLKVFVNGITCALYLLFVPSRMSPTDGGDPRISLRDTNLLG